jgi:Protein of unknown function (DUF3296).
MERRGHKLPYVWVAELQKRGALHYHVLLWLPRGLTLPNPTSKDGGLMDTLGSNGPDLAREFRIP